MIRLDPLDGSNYDYGVKNGSRFGKGKVVVPEPVSMEMDDGDGKSPREGVDFYREGPYLVFTAHFLRNRGYCCDSGCRHCPWKSAEDVSSETPPEG